MNEHNIKLIDLDSKEKYEAIIISVAHEHYINMAGDDFVNLIKDGGIIFDLKNVVPKKINCLRL